MNIKRIGAIVYVIITLLVGLFGKDVDFHSMLLLPVLFGVLSGMILLSPPALIYYFIRWMVRKELNNYAETID